jgi:predicted solute-binding protein
MRVVVHDSLATASVAEPARLGWVEGATHIVLAESPEAVGAVDQSMLLWPAPEATLLVDTHAIVPDVAIVEQSASAVALRTPVRPDALEETVVRLYETSATGELLARALMWPYFGLSVTAWIHEPDADAAAVVVEGAMALQEPEAGFTTDLGKAWFVMTGMPVVSHVLLVPRSAPPEERAAAITVLQECIGTAWERRRELRPLLDERYGVPRERLVDYLSSQRHILDEKDREALTALLLRGAGGSRYQPLTRLPFVDDEMDV